MDKEERRKSLLALSQQQGHYGSIDIESVLCMIELRDDKIKELLSCCSESQSGKD